MSPIGPGVDNAWSVAGAPTPWQAVAQASDDSSYVFGTVVGSKSDFQCGDAQAPLIGRVMAVTLHYRIMQTSSGSASVALKIMQGATPHLVGSVVLSGTLWTEGTIRIREDWVTATRFTGTELTDLGVGLELTGATTGEVRTSKLWLAIEFVDAAMFYDPYDGVLPDIVTGPRQMVTLGTSVASIVSNYLQIAPGTSADYRAYFSVDPTTVEYRHDYITETEIRCTLVNSATLTNEAMFLHSAVQENTGLRSVFLYSVRIAGSEYLGLASDTSDPFNISAYADIKPFSALGRDLHVRLKIDRDNTPSTYGKVEVFINYATTPTLSAWFESFVSGPAIWTLGNTFGTVRPGTSLNTTEARIDHTSFKHYKKRGETFKAWKGWDFGANSIRGNTMDLDIVKPRLIEPPGVMVGQSQHACELDVQTPPLPCSAANSSVTPEVIPISYKVDVIYKMDVAGKEGELRVQRLSDLYFWDETAGAWDPAPQAVTLANQLTRTQVAVMTGITVTAPNDRFFVTVDRKTAVGAPYKIFIYKVHLVEE